MVPGEFDLFVAFGSSSVSIAASPWECARDVGLRPQIDRTALADMCAFPLLPADPARSLLDGVTRIPATSSAIVTGAEVSVTSSRTATPLEPDADLNTSVTRLRDAIERSVAASVDGAAQVAVLVTGGLDSAVVAAACRRSTGRPPVLVSAGGRLRSAGEDRRLALLAQHLEAPLIDLAGPFSVDAGQATAASVHAPWPRGNVFSGVWGALARRCEHEGVSTVLTGEGGNEVFSPGGAELFDYWRLGPRWSAVRRAGLWRDSDRPRYVSSLRERSRTSWLPTTAWNSRDSLPDWFGLTVDELQRAGERWSLVLGDARASGITATEGQAMACVDALRNNGAHDPQGRVSFQHPLVRREVLDTYFSTPLEHRYPSRRGTRDKALLRLVARELLPAGLSEPPKVGPANQVAVLAQGRTVTATEEEQLAAEWLGFEIDDAYRKPSRLRASLGLDWCLTFAFVAWAANAVIDG